MTWHVWFFGFFSTHFRTTSLYAWPIAHNAEVNRCPYWGAGGYQIERETYSCIRHPRTTYHKSWRCGWPRWPGSALESGPEDHAWLAEHANAFSDRARLVLIPRRGQRRSRKFETTARGISTTSLQNFELSKLFSEKILILLLLADWSTTLLIWLPFLYRSFP